MVQLVEASSWAQNRRQLGTWLGCGVLWGDHVALSRPCFSLSLSPSFSLSHSLSPLSPAKESVGISSSEDLKNKN